MTTTVWQPVGMIEQRALASLAAWRSRRAAVARARRVRRARWHRLRAGVALAAGLVAVMRIWASWMPEAAIPAGETQARIACWGMGPVSIGECARRQRANHLAAAREIRRQRAAIRRLSGELEHGIFTSPVERGLLCIHTHEAGWHGDANPIYDGGLQFDNTFERSYGGWARDVFGADASGWPVSVQLATALRAYYSGRGYGPWPQTRRMCGL